MAINKTASSITNTLGKIQGKWLILLTALVSGFSIFLNSFAVKGFDSSVFTFSKNIVVALFLFSIIYFAGQFSELKKLTKKDWKQLVLIGLIGGSIPFLLFFKGLQMSSGSTASFIHKTLFIVAGAMALIFLKEKLNKWTIIGVVSILIGTYVTIRPNFNLSMGHLLILIAVVFWSAENIIAKKALKKLSGNTVAFGRMFFGSLLILVYLIATSKVSTIFTMNSGQYIWVLITSLLLLLYVVTYYNGLKHTSVTVATAILSLGAPITAILSLAYGNGTIGIYDTIGMFCIIFGSVLMLYFAKPLNISSNAHSKGA